MSDPVDTSAFGVFRVGDRLIGIPISNLAEVCSIPLVSKVMAPQGPVIGAFDLRGNLVPLLDVRSLSALGDQDHAAQRAVVLQHDGRVLAVVVDEIVRLAEARPIRTRGGLAEKPDGVPQAGHDTLGVFPSGFVMDGEVVSCLSADALFARPDIMSVAHIRAAARQTGLGHNGKYLIFCAGGAHFGVDTKHVSATVPKSKLDTEGVRVEGGLCLGFTDHFGWRAPVVDTNRTMGVGVPMAPSETETVLLRFPDDNLLGLHVDRTERLTSIPQNQLQHSSSLISRGGLLPKVHITRDGTQVFVIDFEALSGHKDLLSFSGLSSRTPKVKAVSASETRPDDNAVRENERYLIIEAGATLAVPAASVSSILRVPNTIVPGQNLPSGVKGFFSHGDRSVPLVILPQSDHLGIEDGYVLLVTTDRGQVGFFATRICAMKTSEWRIPNRGAATETADLIKIRNPDQKGLVAVTDLDGIARSLVA